MAIYLIGARMTRLCVFALCMLLAHPVQVMAQHGSSARPAVTAPAEAAQFDFLIGQWELEVKPKVGGLAAMIHGAPRLVGTWKAWRAFDGFGVDDELRIVDASGNPSSLTHAMRIYDRNAGHWKVTAVDVYRSRVTSATAQWQDGEMRLEGRGVDAEGKPYVTRTRYHDIGPDRFTLEQDRSTDDGQSWDEGVLVIEATRVAATASR